MFYIPVVIVVGDDENNRSFLAHSHFPRHTDDLDIMRSVHEMGT